MHSSLAFPVFKEGFFTFKSRKNELVNIYTHIEQPLLDFEPGEQDPATPVNDELLDKSDGGDEEAGGDGEAGGVVFNPNMVEAVLAEGEARAKLLSGLTTTRLARTLETTKRRGPRTAPTRRTSVAK